MYDRLTAVRRALGNAPAHAIPERLAAALDTGYRITETELLQVDYRLAALLPLTGGDAVTAPGHPAWRCFDHQEPVIHERVGYFPVSRRGERVGVLRLAPAPTDSEEYAELVEIAGVLAHELGCAESGTDRYTVAARTRRLTLAAEMQWELLPGRSRVRPSFALAGQLEPAYAVRGDSFDWSDDEHRLWLSTLNGMGEEVSASTLTSLATHALRNARRAGLALADQATLADQAIYAYHRGTQYVSVLLMELELATGLMTVVDAGSPRLVLLRQGKIVEQPLDAQLPLGMFDGTVYETQRFQLEIGDRLFVLSDGVLDATSKAGRYGESALDRFLRRTGPMTPLEAVRSLLGDLRAFVSAELNDDAVVVCLDWTGQQT